MSKREGGSRVSFGHATLQCAKSEMWEVELAAGDDVNMIMRMIGGVYGGRGGGFVERGCFVAGGLGAHARFGCSTKASME